MKASLVIPTYNKLGRLKLVLESLKYQNEDTDNYEVLLIDDGSDDGTWEYLERLKVPFDLQVIRQNNSGRASARNTGLRNANYNIIIFSDDDMILSSDFIQNHIKCHSGKNHVVHGRIMNLPFTKFFKDPTEGTFMDGLDIRASFSKGLASKRISCEMIRPEVFDENITKKGKVTALESFIKMAIQQYIGMIDWLSCVGGNFSANKSTLEEVNGFDEKFGLNWGCEDIELGYRLMKKGYSFYYAEDAVNYHLAHYRSDFSKEHAINLDYFYQKYHDEQILLFQEFISENITREEFLEELIKNQEKR
ncbi:MAG: glycosyltransferase [Lachnospiraceae bacterium]|nr:glycosyltransferase [Lachnospiraceae bacterium]